MKNLIILFVITAAITFVSCDIDQTKEGKLPEIDVDVDTKAGVLPEFEVNWADVDVGTRTQTIKIPKVVVVMEEEEVEVPYLDVDMPGDGEREERTIAVEVEVKGVAHNIDIEEIYATGNRLIVVSRLNKGTEKLGKETMRVSDRIVLNAPDLDVKHYIIGSKPVGAHNRQYTYVNNKSAISSKISKATRIYKS